MSDQSLLSFRDALERVIVDYPLAIQHQFKGHPFPSYVKKVVAKSVSESLKLPAIYSVKASVGNGSWAKVPWIAIFNNLVTESVKSGFYCVYLFRVDLSGVYLSLNQGIADKRDQYGLGVSRQILRNQSASFRNKLSFERLEGFSDPLDLRLSLIPKETTSRRLGLAYEAGNIASKFYSGDNLPNEKVLLDDLQALLVMYEILFEETLKQGIESDDSPKEWIEDLTRYSLHRGIERNQTLTKKVKQLQGSTCKACGFNFEACYGEIGKGYIESHHNIPISSLEKAKIQLDPLKDFTVLCSNCHRMIHRLNPVPTLEEFRKILLL